VPFVRPNTPMSPFRSAGRIATIYLVLSVAWIYFSDRFLAFLFPDAVLITAWQTYKGWFFVTASALLIFSLVRRTLTQYQQVLSELIESEKYNRMLFDQSVVGLALCRMDGHMADINPAYARIIGRTIEETLALTYWDITPEWYKEQERSQLENLEKTGSYGPYEKCYRHKDGHLVPVRLQGRIIGKLGERFIWSSVEDISSEKQAEERALRWKHVFESAEFGLAHARTTDNTFTEVNDTFARQRGYTPEELKGRPVLDIYAWAERTLVQQRLRAVDESGHAVFESRHVRKDGTEFPVLMEVTSIRDSHGQAVARVSYSIDISEQKATEFALSRSQQQLLSLVEYAPHSIAMLDRELRYLVTSRRWLKEFGRGSSDLSGLCHYEILPDLPDWWRDVYQKGLEGEYLENDEDLWIQADGTRQWLRWAVLPWYDTQGRIGGIIISTEDITERKRYEEQLQHQATHDELTDLANRNLLYDRLEQSIHFASRSGRLVAVLLLDLDRFKLINDSLGHPVGDALLCAVAKRLQGAVREADTVARLGGDEFVVLLAEVAEDADVGLVAHKILVELALPHRIDDREITVTASVGISLYPKDSADPTILIRNADVAMYRAKREGGNSFSFYAPEMNQRALATLELENALRQALDQQEFCLHYQPKVDLASGRISGCEALVRWQHPVRGMISPADFIPLAEETGLIVPLGNWVLSEACRQVKAWQDEGLPTLSVAVNLSARQFSKGDLPQIVGQILENTGMAPDGLVLEITESMIMDDPTEAIGLMEGLRKIGVRLALDDFGTGYSSLSYLSRFPIDHVKIDRSFVKGLSCEMNATCIAAAIVALAHRMQLKVVAEGVETEAQLNCLRNYDCDEIQGFLFSRPLGAEHFAELLRQNKTLFPIDHPPHP